MMNKTETIFNALSIQLTQRCNLACAHCCRGDARPVDISREVIDALLHQVTNIMTLTIGGGEPMLAPDTFGYLVDRIIKRNTMVMRAQVITNGTQKSELFGEHMQRLQAYIEKKKEETGHSVEDICHIIISNDKYHDAQGITPKQRRGTAFFYMKHYGIPTDIQERQINDWMAMGRAKNGLKGTNTLILNRLRKVDIERSGNISIIGGNEIDLCIELLADGNLMLDGGIENGYPERHPETVLCNVLTDSIADALEAWNKKHPNELSEKDITEFIL